MVKRNLTFLIGQINPIVGDIKYNAEKIIQIIKSNENVDVIIFPEMILSGYPLMDHILDPIIRRRNKKYIKKIKNLSTNSAIILGTFTEPNELKDKIQRFYNSALVIEGQEIKHIENKRLLPNYDVFDERRYFSFDEKLIPTEVKGVQVGLLICEDLWDEQYELKVAKNLVQNGAELLIIINASPYHIGKFRQRTQLVSAKSKKFNIPIIYVNMVGGLDEIVYDGRSFITNHYGQIVHTCHSFVEDYSIVEINIDEKQKIEEQKYSLDWREEVLEALKLNLYDYFHKTNIFDGVVLGLSGGIDSAFTAYVCAQALGPRKVNCIMLPTKFTSQESLNYAKKLCKNLDLNYIIHPIENLFLTYENSIEKKIGSVHFGLADENLQARIRATLLMYYSNKYDWLLVSTGNKSEIAVGYCTLYGDTCGGKNVPGDLLKVQIYDICRWINRNEEIIPNGIITRPPTAELREDQRDSDSLPPYAILDQILQTIINYGIGNEEQHLKNQGINISIINKIRKLYLNAEFKRRQLVQSIKVSPSAFGIGRRYPVLKSITLDNHKKT